MMDLEKRLDNLEAKVDSIAVDVRSLLETRSFAQGVWKAVVTIAAIVSATVSGIIAWLTIK